MTSGQIWPIFSSFDEDIFRRYGQMYTAMACSMIDCFDNEQGIRAADLPPYLYRRGNRGNLPGKKPLRFVQDEAEIDAIRSALKATGYNKARAATRLGIHRSLLYKKMKKFGLPLKPDI